MVQMLEVAQGRHTAHLLCPYRCGIRWAIGNGSFSQKRREEPLVFSVVTVTVETFLAWKQWKRFCESQLLFNRNSYL
ncbi:MAG: hypothetical protein EAZ43_09275 [Betaproteobacteria bacterium]|nr:MAG: hypothetical protein EAZ43_09275 [Betaproteobacteria bacterium]